jgi:galactose mutarotase-like enzyme
MITLSNGIITACIHPLGAELQKLYRSDTGLDYLWNGDPAFWGKFSPVLFPIVGTLKDNFYLFNGKQYSLPRHGFAREKIFQIDRADNTRALLTLQESPETLAVFPFPFRLQLAYSITDNELQVRYSVINKGSDRLYFSLGAHPAFKVPFLAGTTYTDYRIVFSEPETAGRWGLVDGLLRDHPEPFLAGTRELPLSSALFEKDAIVLKHLKSETVSLAVEGSEHGLDFRISGWPHLGIWAPVGAPFVCIEPWQGHADPLSHDGQLIRKPGILSLSPGELWENEWRVSVF